MRNKTILFAALALLLSACTTAPNAVPTATSAPVPTLAPAPTLAPSPTSAPSPTVSPSSATVASPTLMPTVASPATSQPTGTPTAGLCSNPFYPVQSSALWTYRVLTQTPPQITFKKSITNLTDNSFTEHHAFDSVAIDQHWTCSSGGLASTDFGNLHLHGQNQFNFTTTSSTGITIPPADQWAVGYRWSNSYNISGQFAQNGITLSGTGKVNLDNTIAANQVVSVEAGEYQAYRVDTTMTLNITPSGVVNLPVTLTLQQSSWYARNVGLVKSTLTMNSQTATTELVTYSP